MFPAASVAEHVTIVVAMGKIVPDCGEQVAPTMPSMLSTAVALNVTVTPCGLFASKVISAGTVNTGGMESMTLTTNVAVALLPAASVAVQVTVVVPRGKRLPEWGEQVTATVPSTLSVAVASNATSA